MSYSQKVSDGNLLFWLSIYDSAYQKKGNPYSKAHCILKSIDLKICVWHISKEQLILFPLVHFLHQVCHSMTEYIAIEDDNVMTHFCEVWTIG